MHDGNINKVVCADDCARLVLRVIDGCLDLLRESLC